MGLDYLLYIPARNITKRIATMPLNPPRVLVLRAHALEIFISGAAITLGLFVWLSMKDSNSGVNLLAGAALLVAGIILFVSAMKTILKY
jgi:hypothetical protein